MKIGLVGFAGSGKTTVFNTMTGLAVLIGYGGEVRLGAVCVPDERIDALSKIFAPKKTTYAEMSFCDIPGEHGAERKGLSTKALQQIREQDALCLVLRDFENPADEGQQRVAPHKRFFSISRARRCGRSLWQPSLDSHSESGNMPMTALRVPSRKECLAAAQDQQALPTPPRQR